MTDHMRPHKLPRWLIMVAKSRGRKAVYRVRADRAAADLAILVSIKWPYAERDEDGFPAPAVRRAMDALDAAFDEITEAELVLVTTGMGVKEWAFYTGNFGRFIDEFDGLRHGKPRAPVMITYRFDPGWQYWRLVRRHAKPYALAS